MSLEVRRAYPSEETNSDFVRVDPYLLYEIGVPSESIICIEHDGRKVFVWTVQTDVWEHGQQTIRIPKPIRQQLKVEVGGAVSVTKNTVSPGY